MLINPDAPNMPPMLMADVSDDDRKLIQEALIAAGKYACRCATMNGRIVDFDPDALIGCLIHGMFGPKDRVTLKESDSGIIG